MHHQLQNSSSTFTFDDIQNYFATSNDSFHLVRKCILCHVISGLLPKHYLPSIVEMLAIGEVGNA